MSGSTAGGREEDQVTHTISCTYTIMGDNDKLQKCRCALPPSVKDYFAVDGGWMKRGRRCDDVLINLRDKVNFNYKFFVCTMHSGLIHPEPGQGSL